MTANPDYKAYYDREISSLSDGKVKDIAHRKQLNADEHAKLKAELAKEKVATVEDYRNWLLNLRDKSGKPISPIYSQVLGFDEVQFVKGKCDLSDSQISDLQKNCVYLFNVTQGELMEPFMETAKKYVTNMDSEFILGIRETKSSEARWISSVGQLAS